MQHYLIFSIIYLLLAVLSSLSGKEISVRFMAAETSLNDVFIRNGSEYKKISIPTYQTTDYFTATVNNSNEIELFRQIQTVQGERYERLVGGQLTSKSNSVLAVYLLGANGQAYLYLHDDDWDRFPAQSFRLINLSPVAIRSKVGEETLQLNPMQSEVVNIEYESRLPLVKIITIYKDNSEQWKPIYNKKTALMPRSRLTGFAVVSRGGVAKAMGATPTDSDATQTNAALKFFPLSDRESNIQLDSQDRIDNQAIVVPPHIE